MNVQIKKINDKAVVPVYATIHCAGADLCSTEFAILRVGERRLFKTGMSLAIPSGVYGRIAPRSGLALKGGIDVLAGVIDEDYRGEIGVILINHGVSDWTVYVGDKIAQIVFERYERVVFEEVEELSETARGVGGFGSTDKGAA
jgi:dUTP pyrophosphatase